MDKDRRTIAATELSKFEYCPYQWYYERLYGRNELRRLEKERNERLGLDDRRKERLEAGVIYHTEVYNKKSGRFGIAIVLVIMLAVAMYFIMKAGAGI